MPLAELPDNHPAIQYLLKRRFDPAQLAKRWGVYFCESNIETADENHGTSPHFYDCADHLSSLCDLLRHSTMGILPARQGLRLAGWQARAVNDHPLKYMSALGMKKSELLYGLPSVIKTKGPVVVAEGVTDVLAAADQRGGPVWQDDFPGPDQVDPAACRETGDRRPP